MITLRGRLRRVPPEDRGGSDASPPVPLWKWTGVWAFGSLPDDDGEFDDRAAAVATIGGRSGGGGPPNSKKRKSGGGGGSAAAPRPFAYEFHEATNAASVAVPSAAAASSSSPAPSDDGGEGVEEKVARGGGGVPSDAGSKGEDASPGADAAKTAAEEGGAAAASAEGRTGPANDRKEKEGAAAVAGGDSENTAVDDGAAKEEGVATAASATEGGDADAEKKEEEKKGPLDGKVSLAVSATVITMAAADGAAGTKEASMVNDGAAKDGSTENSAAITANSMVAEKEAVAAHETDATATATAKPDKGLKPEASSTNDAASAAEGCAAAERNDEGGATKRKTEEGEASKDKANDERSTTSTTDQKGPTFALSAALGKVNFATSLPGEPSYTDAGKATPDLCPVGGSWKGYFENVTKKKDRNANRVSETFYLFFNATPPFNARVTFPDEEDETEEHESVVSKSDGPTADVQRRPNGGKNLLPNGRLHVRGMGTNQFGTFEIIGSFNPKNGVLHIQRMYVATPDSDSAPTSNRSKKSSATPRATAGVTTRDRSRSKRTPFGSPAGTSITPTRLLGTRKRQPTWRLRAADGVDSDDDASRKSGGSTAKKKPRTLSESSKSTAVPAGQPTPGKGLGGEAIGKLISTGRGSPGGLSIGPLSSVAKAGETDTDAALALAGGIRKQTTPSPRSSPGGVVHKKAKSGSGKSGGSLSQGSVGGIKLPPAGEPRNARWRAAHFLYYQRIDPSTGDPAAPGSNDQTAINFVVYEGEMNRGNSIREGRGVCLYSNDTLYEGTWKKNKEHGKGKLMTADHRHLIYSGDWERGRMHGHGTYYYHLYGSAAGCASDGKDGGTYQGDFKENARHGIGIYTLSDNSSYDGEWRDNVPCGRGTFRWPDGSTYIGQWKDGQRHGQGVLRASDGFTYDGSWVRNGMEGRGIAVYPNGQVYEGMFSGGRREGRGTIRFTNGAVYEGRFKDDCMEGQGTMKMSRNVVVPRGKLSACDDDDNASDVIMADTASDVSAAQEGKETAEQKQADQKDDWMIPIEFQSDIGHIHQKAGFTTGGD